MPILALTKKPAKSLANCELTHMDRTPIDVELAARQHDAYRKALETLGCEVHCLPADEKFPDSVFVEDTATVADEFALITLPGAKSRREETKPIEEFLKKHRKLEHLSGTAKMDGGDVFRWKKNWYIGESSRTNREAIKQTEAIAKKYGYTVIAVPVKKCLHLKTGATLLSDTTLLINPEWIDKKYFPGLDFIDSDPSEPFACNAVRTENGLVFPADFPKTAERLRKKGFRVETVPFSEFAKAEGGVTCCSILIKK